MSIVVGLAVVVALTTVVKLGTRRLFRGPRAARPPTRTAAGTAPRTRPPSRKRAGGRTTPSPRRAGAAPPKGTRRGR